MKRREVYSGKRGANDLTKVRFFQYLPGSILNSLSKEQKQSIILAILELQENNPRILEEIYMEQPFPGREPGKWTLWDRVKRRTHWKIKHFWLGLLQQKSETRFRTRLGDYLFLMFMVMLVLFGAYMLLLVLYWVKSDLLQIDVFPGFHLFSR